MSLPVVRFYFDICCPFAYLASTQLQSLSKRTGIRVEWIPVLLGGIYELTKAKQGKTGSATDTMSVQKRSWFERDFGLQLNRAGSDIKQAFKFHPQHPVKTVHGIPFFLS